MKKMRKLLCLLLALLLVASLLPAVWAAELPFQDVAPGSWYETYVDYAYSNGLMNGTGEGLFSPDTNMSRGMIVTVLHRLEGSPAASAALPFDDVPGNQYYYAPVVWSYENGIVNGVSDTKFAPNSNVTREQLVTIFYRYANTKGYDTSAQADLSGFSDAAAIQSYAAGALSWAVAEGIITGMDAATLSPGGFATRAQFAAIVQRFNAWADTQTTEQGPTEPSTEATEATDPTEETNPSEETVPPETEPPEPVQVADPVDLSALNQLPQYAVQDIRYYTDHQVKAKKEPTDTHTRFSSLPNDLVEAYVAMLQENGFTLVEAYSESYSFGDKFMSWGLTYDAAPELETIGQQFVGNECHLCIWKSGSNSSWTCYIEHVPELVLCDLGIRMDGTTADLTPKGESLGAGLIRLPDGSYQTDDGRLSTNVGSAVVVRDGAGLSGSVNCETDDSDFTITISGYMPEESISLKLNEETLVQNSIYDKYDFEGDDITFTATVDGEDITQFYNSKIYDSIFVRVMYYEPDGDAVFYIHASTTGTEPKEIEALCAVSTVPEPEKPMPEYDEEDLVSVSGYGDETIYLTTDQVLEIYYSHREFDSAYHVFDWKITEGSDLVEVYGAYDSRTFFPTGAGVVVVKMRYEYTKEEADVLTGYPRDNPKSKHYTYSIIIEEP